MANLTDPLGVGRTSGSGDPAGDYNLTAAQVNNLYAHRERLQGQDAAYSDIYVPDGVVPVALRCDDGPYGDYTTGAPGLRDRSGTAGDPTKTYAGAVVAGYALIGKHYNPASPGYDGGGAASTAWLQPAAAVQMQSWGMEMMNHSRYHDAAGPDLTALYDNVIGNGDEIAATGLWVNAFVTPGPWSPGLFDTPAAFESPLGMEMRRRYVASMGYVVGGFKNSVAPFPVPNPHGITVTPDSDAASKYNSVVAGFQQAQAHGGALLELTHTGSYGAAGSASWNDFFAAVDYLIQQREAGLCRILTPSALIRAKRGTPVNLCPDPSFEYATSGTPASSPWAIGSSTGAAGRLTGNSLAVPSGSSATLSIAHSPYLRTLEITGWARAASGSATARIVKVSKAGSTTIATHTKSVAVVDTEWRFFRTYFGTDPNATITQIQLAQSTGTVQFDDISIYKS